jgi:hypothetical protein
MRLLLASFATAGYIASNSNFWAVEALTSRGLFFLFHEPPPASPISRQFAAFNDIPVSEFKIYVINFLYPIAFAAHHDAE